MSGYDSDKSGAAKTVVVVEARRKWSAAEKQAAIADAALSSISAAARKHGVAASLLFRWRRDAADASDSPIAKKVKGFVPVKVAANMPANVPALGPPATTSNASLSVNPGMIEIELVSGHKLRVSGSVEVHVLKHVIAALDGRPVRRSTECEGG